MRGCCWRRACCTTAACSPVRSSSATLTRAWPAPGAAWLSVPVETSHAAWRSSAPSCQPEHVANSRGSFRWPRTSAGLLSFLPCVSEPSGTGRAWRRCEPAGRWAEADYGQCVYLSQVTRALQELSQTHVNGSNAQAIAQRLSSISSSAEHFGDSMDVILVTHILEKLVQHTDLLRDLAEHVAGVAGDMTRVEERHLWAAQSRVRACTRIVRCVERVADLQLPTTLQLVLCGSLSILLQVFLLQPSSLIGVACAVAQRGPLALEGMEPRPRSGRVCTESVGGVLLGFRCSAAQINGSLSAVAGKSSAAAASLQLPLPAANGTCRLQVLVFRNGKLFPCTNNATRLAEEVKRGALSAPVAFVKLDGCRLGSRSFPVTVSLRRFLLGTSWESTDGQWWPVSDPEPPDGRVRWSADGCSVTGSAKNVTTVQCVRRGHFAVLMDLKRVLSFPPYPGEFLHPVVYACTAVMLLCLFASIITYIVHHSTIRISRKGWHMLLNFCFHTALTFAVFAGGINRIKYPIFCKAVGIVLHYSSLSTMLWLGVTARNIYKQVSKVPRQVQDSDPPAQHKQPMLRFYLVSGGVPLIICGITAATNIDNYGRSEEAPYCWMAWEPSLGAFYGPVAFIVLVTCVYFLCAFIQMKKHPQRKYELRTVTEEQQRLATAEMSHCHAEESRGAAHMGHGHSHTACSPLSASTLANEHSFKAQLRAAAFTLFLFLCTWTFGALAVSQGHILDMIFSCLYGAFSVTLGLFLLIHHCAKRDDVWHCWCSCCPSRHTRPKLNVNGDSQIHVSRCHLDPPCAGHAHIHTPSAHCKLTNLQAAQNHVSCLSPAPPCCVALHSQQLLEDETHTHSHAHPHTHAHPEPHLHRCVKGRTKPRHLARPREYTYHLPSSVDGGSIHSSHTDSPRSVHERRACLTPEGHTVCHRHPCCAKAEPFPTVCQPEGSSCCCRSAGDEELARCVHVELQPRRQSYPLNPASQNGILKSGVHESFLYSSDSTGNIRTGPWRNETTV